VSTDFREQAGASSLPRPLRDPELLRHIQALDALHQNEKRAGSFAVEVHYDHLGNPKKVWVRTNTELHPINQDAER
jgi:hypothetical protein